MRKLHNHPFMSKEEFEACKADVLFPVKDYEIAKSIWESSPLINFLIKTLNEEVRQELRKGGPP